jgi:site-specific DNA-methyltransferase (adenine-specific)
MGELNKKNCFIIKQIFNGDKKYKLNLYNGDTLSLDIKREFNVDKFDIIIGNPPYNTELKSTGASPLYNKFIEKYINSCKYLSFIIPSRWFSSGKGLDKFREDMLNRQDIVFIKHTSDASKVFGKSVSISGGVNYFLIDKDYKGECMFNGMKLNLNKYDVLVDKRFYSIIDKVSKFDNITTIYNSQFHYGIETNDSRLKDKKNYDNNVLCYVSQKKGFKKYINKKFITNSFDNYKVIVARTGENKFGNIFIGDKNEVHSKSYISFNVKNKNEGESLISILKSKLSNVLLVLRKNSHDISSNTVKWIPLLPLDRIWNDKEIYKYLKLTDNEIKLIDNINLNKHILDSDDSYVCRSETNLESLINDSNLKRNILK